MHSPQLNAKLTRFCHHLQWWQWFMLFSREQSLRVWCDSHGGHQWPRHFTGKWARVGHAKNQGLRADARLKSRQFQAIVNLVSSWLQSQICCFVVMPTLIQTCTLQQKPTFFLTLCLLPFITHLPKTPAIIQIPRPWQMVTPMWWTTILLAQQAGVQKIPAGFAEV